MGGALNRVEPEGGYINVIQRFQYEMLHTGLWPIDAPRDGLPGPHLAGVLNRAGRHEDAELVQHYVLSPEEKKKIIPLLLAPLADGREGSGG